MKTNIPGFRKNRLQNVLIPENAEEKISAGIHAQRAAHKKQRGLEERIERLEQEIGALRKVLIEVDPRYVLKKAGKAGK